MRITTTDGKEYIIPDLCAGCELDSAGGHDPRCPLYSTYRIWNNKEDDVWNEFEKLGMIVHNARAVLK